MNWIRQWINDLVLFKSMVVFQLRSRMQYKASFLMAVLGNACAPTIDFIGVYAMFNRFGEIHGWTLYEVAVMYGLICMSFGPAMAICRAFDLFDHFIRNGDFDRVLIRPYRPALMVMGSDVSMRTLGRGAIGLGLFLWGLSHLDLSLSLDAYGLIIWTIIGGICFFSALLVFQATLCFWTVESLEVMNIVIYGGLAAAEYPMSIYKSWLQKFFIFVVPLACINYFPVVTLLHKTTGLHVPIWIGWLTPIAGVLFLGIASLAWRCGVRHYCSTGS